MKPEMLNQVVNIAVDHIRKKDKLNWPRPCNQYSEFKDDDKYFLDALNKDFTSEMELSEKLSKLLNGSEGGAFVMNEQLTLLCLSGHVARLESRNSFLDSLAAIFTIAIAVWSAEAIKNLPWILVASLMLSLTVVIKWQLNKRVRILKRVAEHLQYQFEALAKNNLLK